MSMQKMLVMYIDREDVVLRLKYSMLNNLISYFFISLPDSLFVEMLHIVSNRLGIDSKLLEEAEEYFANMGRKQGGILTAQNFKAVGCPNL